MPLSKHDVTHLARECLNEHNGWNFPDWVTAAQKLARVILSGDMKREIENAAYRRCIEIADKAILDGNSSAPRVNRLTVDQIKNDILAHITLAKSANAE